VIRITISHALVLTLLVGGCAQTSVTLKMIPAAVPAALKAAQAARVKLHAEGEPAAAASLARQALKHDPHLASAYETLGLLSQLKGDPKGAFEHWLRALADGRSTAVASYLDQIDLGQLGRGDLLRLARLLEGIAARHSNRPCRAEATSYLIMVELTLGRMDAARRALERRGVIRRWQAIGGFDNEESKGFDTPYGPEREVALDRRYPGQRGESRWRVIDQRGSVPALELDEYFYPFSWNVAYLLTYIESPKEQPLTLELTSTDPIKVWINDREVFANREVRHARHRQFRIPLRLRRGHNKLLIKSCQRTGSWRVGAWLAKEDGTPVKLATTVKPGTYTADAQPPQAYDPVARLPHRLAQGTPWAGLWRASALSAVGLRPSAITLLSGQQVRLPKSAPLLLLTARLQRAEKQLQQASRLLEQGIKLVTAEHAAAFWLERAHHLRRRGQYDKAFGALERARAAAPGSTRVLAGLDLLYGHKGWHLDRCRLADALRIKYPDWHWPLSKRARCAGALGRPREELLWLQRAVQLRPANEPLLGRLVASYMRLGRCAEAVVTQRRIASLRTDRVGPQVELGKVLRRCGRFEEAQRTFDSCAAKIPSWHRPYELKGDLLYEQGDKAAAITQWRAALKRNPDHVKLWDRVTYHKPDQDPVLDGYAPSDQEVAQVIQQARQVKPTPGASSVWLLDDEVSHLMPDGTIKRLVTRARLVVDRAGRDSLGEARLPRRGLLKVLEAYTVDRRGRRREVTSLHGRRVRYPTLEEGAIVVLKYRHVTHPTGFLRHHMAATWLFQHALEQVVRARWIVALPPERKAHVHIQGTVKHAASKAHGLTIHTFTSEDVPPLRPERNSLPAKDLLRSVTISTVPSWDYFTEWSHSLTSEVFAMDPDLRQLLRKIAAGKQTMREKVNAVYHHALTQIRYQQDYETFIAGVKPHTASAVLARGYGDCKDKSVLIIGMLRELGIKAHLALIRTRRAGAVLADVPSQQFNHAVVYLPTQPGIATGRFLDATAENQDIDVLRRDVQGTLALVLFPGKHRLIPVPYQPAGTSFLRVKVQLDLRPDGAARAVVDLIGKGGLAGKLRKPLQNQQIQQQYAQSLVNQLYPGCSLVRVKVTNQRTILKPLIVRLWASCDKAARLDQEGRLRLQLPKISRVAGIARWTERRHPLFLGPPTLIESELRLKIPGGLAVENHPKALSVDEPCVQMKGSWRRVDGGLAYSQRFVRSCPIIRSGDHYKAFRAAVTKAKHYLEEEVLIGKVGAEKGKPGKTSARKRPAGKRPAGKRVRGR
jgi:tetratricopeptide (TPR) repeat protein